MKIRFPNPYGYFPPPAAEAVTTLQSQSGFSEDYAEFLRTQNGLSFDRLGAAGDAASRYLHGQPDAPAYPDLRVLYGYQCGDPHYELGDRLNPEGNMFHRVLLAVGEGYDGNLYVEVLAGQHKGCIASLDHELHAASDSLQDFCDEMELGDPDALSAAALADRLMDEDLGLAWKHADSFDQFLCECVHLDTEGGGFVRDAGTSA